MENKTGSSDLFATNQEIADIYLQMSPMRPILFTDFGLNKDGLFGMIAIESGFLKNDIKVTFVDQVKNKIYPKKDFVHVIESLVNRPNTVIDIHPLYNVYLARNYTREDPNYPFKMIKKQLITRFSYLESFYNLNKESCQEKKAIITYIFATINAFNSLKGKRDNVFIDKFYLLKEQQDNVFNYLINYWKTISKD